jgi:hypothetical protein
MENRKEISCAAEKEIKTACWSKWLGITSLIAVPTAFGLGYLFQQIGIMTFLRALVMPLALAAVATGLVSMNKAGENSETARKNGRLGFILGLVSLGAAALIMVAVMLFFLPLLFLSR